MDDNLRETRREQFQLFLTELQTYDMIGLVIVGALYVEKELQQLCRSHFYDPSAIDPAELNFDQWVHLSIAFGLTEKLRPPLKAFAVVRNKFAHRLGFEINSKIVKDLYKSFHGDHRAMMDTSIRKTNQKLGTQLNNNFHEFDEKTKMLMIVTTLRGALVTANWQADQIRQSKT